MWVALAASGIFRFADLGGNPPSLSHDEVAIGYNAYSILTTGRDEYGTRLPLLFRSFDDYKLPGMVYASVPTIALFGLNEWGVRLPSAIFGLAGVAIMFGIARLVLHSDTKASFATLMFALSPWHINFSRQSFEANGSLTFFMLGVLFLLKFRDKARNLIWAAAACAISVYFYYSVRLVLPVVLLTFAIVERKRLLANWRITLTSALVGLLLLSPLLPQIFSSGGLSRISIVSVVNDSVYLTRQQHFAEVAAQAPNPVVRLMYNRRVALGLTILENYTKNLSPKFIFLDGTGSLGLLHRFELPLFTVGIFALFLLPIPARFIMLAWLLAAPLPGAFSINQPNALRTLLNAPMLSFISTLGALRIYDGLTKRYRRAGLVIFAGFLAISLFVFSYSYFWWVPRTKSAVFGDGYRQLASYVRGVEGSYDVVHISGYYWRPYIFMLFWNSYDPGLYQNGGTPEGFGKFRFTAASWDTQGIRMMNKAFIPSELGIKNPMKELIILAGPEYNLHRNLFTPVATIDGKFQKGLFTAALLAYP